MTGAANTAVPAKTEIGLVLQGGGALGAYEWGAITALFDVIDEAIGSGQDITLRVVTGVSIGAINAACVVGATDRADARNRLGAMWAIS
jgi:NTE family protein